MLLMCTHSSSGVSAYSVSLGQALVAAASEKEAIVSLIPIHPPIRTRRGHAVQALAVARVSDPRPGKQDLTSLDDQLANIRAWVAERSDLEFSFKVIAGRGSGERLDRAELMQLEAEIETGRYDLLLVESLDRIARRSAAVMHLMELCEDHHTRVIAIKGYQLDTTWRDSAFF